MRFDFGPSFTFYPQPVSQIIFTALPWTLGLLLVSTVWLVVRRARKQQARAR